jgi:hypothetical protein
MSVALPFSPAVRADTSDARVSGLVLAMISVALFALAAFSRPVLGDGDTWSHLATGEWILAHGAVPSTDPFSHSMPGAPWTAHEWLSEILLTLAFRAAGWTGVTVLTAFAVASAALVMGLRVARDLSGAALGVVVALGVGLWAPTLLARPHILALPLAAAWTAGLLAARDRDASPPLALALPMAFWANMHGGFIFVLALIGPFALEAVLAAPRERRMFAVGGWALFGAAAVGAALLNPYGAEALAFPFRLMTVENLSRIDEWKPQDFGSLGPMETALLALIGFALTKRMAAPPVRAALVVALIAMTLAHTRHALLLGLIAPMLLAGPVARAIGGPPSCSVRQISHVALLASLLPAIAFGALRLAVPIIRTDGPSAPIAALAAVPAEIKGKPVLNAYNFGGYLIFSHVPPFIDGRADMYGGAMLGLYGRLAAGDQARLDETLSRYRIAWTIFAPDDAIVAALDRKPGWRRLYADGFAVVQVRDSMLNRTGPRGD